MAIEYDYSDLQTLMKVRGFSLRRLSKESGIPLGTLSDKINNRTEFKASEIQAIAELLNIRNLDPYFFTLKVR